MRHLGYNFISFDYRACGESEDTSIDQKKNLFLDGDSIVSLQKIICMCLQKISIFTGWSLGGSVASNVKEAHPECTGRSVIERSVSTSMTSSKKLCPVFWESVAGFYLFD